MSYARASLRRNEPLVGYLNKWLVAHCGPWSPKRGEPRFSDEATIRTSKQEQFELLGRMLVERMHSRLATPKPFRYCTLDDDSRNAFAVVPADCSAVLVSTGLVRRVQEVAGQATRQMEQWLCLPPVDAPSIHETWGDLPRDAGCFEAFAGLLAHVAFVFVVHHELAHLVLGHEARWNRGRTCSSASGAAADAGADTYFSEAEFLLVGGAAASADDDVSVDGNQALELDADVHALIYTDTYLKELRDKLAARAGQPEADILDSVWAAVLGSAVARQFAVAAGAVLGLLALVPESGVKELGPLGLPSHPHISLRVLAALKVHADLSVDSKKAQVASTEALLFVLALFGSLQMAQAAVASLKVGRPVTADTLPVPASSDLYGRFRLDEALARFDQVQPHVATLAAHMRACLPSLTLMARAADTDRHRWY